MSLPGRCMGCGRDVVWNGKVWKDRDARPQTRGRHACPEDRPACGAWMPYVRERCARKPGHRYEHRSAYALTNAREARSRGWAA